jgi:small GTP-binding protein
MSFPSLDPARRALLTDTRRQLDELRGWQGRLAGDEAERQALAASLEQLDEGFLLVVVGEFNAGKSAFINALLGYRALEEGVTPTTSRIARLRFGEAEARVLGSDGVETISLNAEPLRAITIVDTPGTNAVLREHEALTRDFAPRADLVVFLTSADRPFTESERTFLEALRQWGKKLVVVVNKLDLLGSAPDVERVLAFVRQQAERTLGLATEVFPFSARLALHAREAGDVAGLAASGLDAFEARVTARLDESERFRLKLLNPVGVARHVCARLEALVAGRLGLLAGDLGTLDALATLLADHETKLERDLRLRLSDVEKVLLEFERRGNAFFDARLRLGRFRELFDRELLRRDFEAAAVADLPRDVERRVEALVDWLVAEDLALWQELMRLLRARQAAHAERLGALDDRFQYDREARLSAVGREAQRAVEGYDAAAEARRLAQGVREAVAGAALLQVSALGLGAIVAALAGSTAADVSGFLAAGTLAALGLLVLPARRRRARRELAAKVATLRERLLAAFRRSFEAERERAGARVRTAVAPYEAFVRDERGRLEQARCELARAAEGLNALRSRLEALGL